MRTGSFGNRDAETLLNTLLEPKRTILGNLRKELLSLGYAEEAGYDAINIESYVAFAISGSARFFLKHKWESLVVVVFHSPEEKIIAVAKFPLLMKKEMERNPEDSTISCKLSPSVDSGLIEQLAKFYAK